MAVTGACEKVILHRRREIYRPRTSLAVQWLRLLLAMQGVQVQSLVGRAKIPHAF